MTMIKIIATFILKSDDEAEPIRFARFYNWHYLPRIGDRIEYVSAKHMELFTFADSGTVGGVIHNMEDGYVTICMEPVRLAGPGDLETATEEFKEIEFTALNDWEIQI